jgi:hypothetical protein
MLSESDQQELRKVFEQEMDEDVHVSLFTKKPSPIVVPGQECATCDQTGELMKEVTSLSEKLQLEVHDFYQEKDIVSEHKIHRIPAVVVKGKARGKVRYFGIPAGLGFPNFIDGLLTVSKGTTSLSEDTRESLGTLAKDVHIQVFTTPM